MTDFAVKKGNTVVLEVAVKDTDDALVTNLADATEIKFQVKESKDSATTKIAKTLTDGIVVNQPSTGYVKITLKPEDTALLVKSYFMGLQIKWSDNEIYEVDLTIDGVGVDALRIRQDVVN